ncbi:MAG: patatin-like phospholipase family protein [Kangiellaceae bacterium]
MASLNTLKNPVNADRRTDQLTEKVCYNAVGQPKTGLVLTGGGARAAFQVGVLKAISQLVYKSHCGNPFPIISGTSAGAINATVLASYSQNPIVGIRSLDKVWRNFSVDQIFRSDFLGIVKQASRWGKSMFVNDYHRHRQLSLLNNKPLGQLLKRVVRFNQIQKAIDANQLDALSVTASGYSSGQSVSFFQGRSEIKSWKRHRRVGCKSKISVEHLLASSAIPLVFPATKLHREFFGDGSVRFLAPLSPTIHLGAQRILVVGVDPAKTEVDRDKKKLHYPSIADISGHVLDSVFVDSLDSDIERARRVNRTLDLIPEDVRKRETNLRKIETFVISPSQDLSEISAKHFHVLPPIVKFFFKRLGIDDDEGSSILSYLLFESSYTRELIELGYQDAMKLKKEILEFFA